MACRKLTARDLRKVRNEVFSAAARWYDIGLELGVTADDLDTIKKANDDPKECLREMLRQWLSNVKPVPSWKALIAALRVPAVNCSALANEIELRYCIRGASAENHHHSSGPYKVVESDIVDLLRRNRLPAAASTPKPRPVPKPRRSKTSRVDDPERSDLSSAVPHKARKVVKDGGIPEDHGKLRRVS